MKPSRSTDNGPALGAILAFCVLLAVCVLSLLIPPLLPQAEETDPLPVAARETGIIAACRVYVDGAPLSGGICGEEKHFAPAAAFLRALDEDFWAGEKAGMTYAPYRWQGEEYLCVEDFCAAYGISTRVDEETGKLWCTSAAGDWEPPAGCRVPVLMYHGVSDEPWSTPSLFVSPAALERQLGYLRDAGYTPIWFEDLKHVDQIEKPVILTFDDGMADNYEILYPLLQAYRVKATFFIIQGTLGRNERVMTAEQVRELSDSGLVSIQCHTLYHNDLDKLSYEQQVEELTWSKFGLLRLTDKEPYVIAYPRGLQNADTLTICAGDYRFGVKMSGRDYITGDDPLLIYRKYIYRDTTLEDFAALLP